MTRITSRWSRGVVHAAAILEPKPLLELTAEEFTRGLRAKAAGAVALDAVIGDLPIDFFVLF